LLPFIGHLKRHVIKPATIQDVITAWQAAGKSARTIRHRRRVLREMYVALDGPRAKPPPAGVKTPKPADPILLAG